MAYRTIYLGQEVICDTIPELDALLSANTISRGARRKRAEKRVPHTIKGWAKGVADKQRELLKALAASHPRALSDIQIKDSLGLESNRKIAGLMGGLAKAAKRAELQFNTLIQKEATRNGTGERHYSYGIAPTAIADVRQGLGLEQ